MSSFKLEHEKPGQAAEERRRRNLRRGFLAMTWKTWYCWSEWMPDEPPWSGPGMVWRYKGELGKQVFGRS